MKTSKKIAALVLVTLNIIFAITFYGLISFAALASGKLLYLAYSTNVSEVTDSVAIGAIGLLFSYMSLAYFYISINPRIENSLKEMKEVITSD